MDTQYSHRQRVPAKALSGGGAGRIGGGGTKAQVSAGRAGTRMSTRPGGWQLYVKTR